ncbi:unnamed protein product [Brassica napus]|uniref:(rape) hypothetical protein n=1 Tax=Brassica napus TaxID=3708 RepID=A0A816QYY8_BRANA|nr:unnamed protein product [Brassica napus]
MMSLHRSLVLFFLFISCLTLSSLALPLCSDSRAPLEGNSTLSFCPYKGKTCCDTKEDSNLNKQFQYMNISDMGCASVVKSILCSRPFRSAICSTKDFCSETWETCQNISITSSLFAPSLQGQAGAPMNTNASKLSDLWQSKTDFCSAFASSNETICFSGEPVTLNDTTPEKPPPGLCLQKIGNGSYLNMVPHPDGSTRAFFSTQPGVVFLAGLPDHDSGGVLDVDPSSPFVNLTDEVHFDISFGVMGMAFHPKFAQNGRFFASFNCDKSKWPGCTGRCSLMPTITSELFGLATWEASSTPYPLLVPLVHISSVGRGTNGIGSHCFRLSFVINYGGCQAVTCVVFFGFPVAICTTFSSLTAISLSHSFIVQTNHKPITIHQGEISGDMVVGSHGKTVNAIATAFILSAKSNKLN